MSQHTIAVVTKRLQIASSVRRMFLAQPFRKMVAAGHYDLKHPDLIKRKFPIYHWSHLDHGVVMLRVEYKQGCSFEEVVQGIRQQGLLPGRIEHLWLVGACRPRLQYQYSIVAPGSIWVYKGMSMVPHLRAWRKKRQAYLRCIHLGWDNRWQFVALQPPQR